MKYIADFDSTIMIRGLPFVHVYLISQIIFGEQLEVFVQRIMWYMASTLIFIRKKYIGANVAFNSHNIL